MRNKVAARFSAAVLGGALVLGSAALGADEREGAAPERKGPAQLSMEKPFDETANGILADKKRDEAIARLETIISRTSLDSPARPEMQFQLSELYWEKSKYLYRAEMRQIDAAWKKYEQARARGEKLPRPKQDHGKSERWRARVVEIYEQILDDAPKYERNDEILFSLGYNLHELGRRGDAIQRYQELIKRYPQSRFVPDTYVQLGDHYFNSNQLLKAKQSYERALKSEVPKVASYALYKLAWCDYNAGEYEGGLDKLKQVVELSSNRSEMFDLRNEALKDLVPMFVALNQVDPAIAYFNEKAPERKTRLLGRMAAQLAEGAGLQESSNRIYRYLIEEEPLHPQAPEFQQAIARNYEKLRQRDKVRAEMRTLVERYRPGGEWWKANEKDRGVLRNAFEVSEEAMRLMVTEYHQEAQKTKQVETYRLARDIYREYVAAFASSGDPSFVADSAFNMRFYYAEILWTLEEWGPAAEQYDAVVRFQIPDRPTAREVSQEDYRKRAAYSAILAWGKLLKIEQGTLAKSNLKDGQKVDEKKEKGGVDNSERMFKRDAKDLREETLTPVEEKLLAACDTYVRLYPDPVDQAKVPRDERDREIDIRFRAAILTYNKNRFLDAAARFAEIIRKWPEDERSRQAADLTMYVLETREEWHELNELARQFLENRKLTRPGSEFAQRVAQVVEGSQYKWAYSVVYQKEKNPAKAADEFVRFVAEFPRSKNAARALTSAMVIHQEAGQLDRAIVAGERVLKEYPGSEFELKVRYNLAGFYEKVADYGKAAEMAEAFLSAHQQWASRRRDEAKRQAKRGRTPPPTPEQRAQADERKKLFDEATGWLADAQYNAGVWWAAAGRADKAIDAYRRYLAKNPTKPDVPKVQLAIALLYEEDGKWAEQARALEQFTAKYAKDPRASADELYLARYRQLVAYQKLGRTRDVERTVDELVRTFRSLPQEDREDAVLLNAYTHARFLAVEPLWKSYEAVKFTNIRTIKRDLLTKQKKLAEVEKAYLAVLASGGADYGIAALTRMALAYEDFAANIRSSPNPRGLNEEQLQMYRDELENLALPLDDKASGMLEKALGKASELAVYTEWTTLAQDRLNRYRPGTYPKAQPVEFRRTVYLPGPGPGPLPGPVGAPAPDAPAPKQAEGGEVETTAESEPAGEDAPAAAQG